MIRVVTLGLGAALLLAGCGGQAKGAAECVPVAAGEADVAYLAVVEGNVTIRRGNGSTEPGRQDMSLSRADTVVTGPDAVVVVVLANCHVLRLAEGQETPVGKLAQLDGPPPTRGFSELFASALGSDDLSRIGGAERLERIAGWNARRASGETPAPVAAAPPPPPARAEGAALDEARRDPPVEAPDAEAPGAGMSPDDGILGTNRGKKSRPEPTDAKESKTDAKKMDSPKPPPETDDIRGEGNGGATPPTAPAKPLPADPVKPEKKAPEAEEEKGSSQSRPAADLLDGWTLETGDKKQVPKASLPAPLVTRRAALAVCLVDARPGVAAPVLRLRVAAGAVTEAKVDGGAAPACATNLVGLKLAVEDGWMIVRVKK